MLLLVVRHHGCNAGPQQIIVIWACITALGTMPSGHDVPIMAFVLSKAYDNQLGFVYIVSMMPKSPWQLGLPALFFSRSPSPMIYLMAFSNSPHCQCAFLATESDTKKKETCDTLNFWKVPSTFLCVFFFSAAHQQELLREDAAFVEFFNAYLSLPVSEEIITMLALKSFQKLWRAFAGWIRPCSDSACLSILNQLRLFLLS